MFRLYISIIIVLLTFLSDQLLKNWAAHSLIGQPNFFILGRLFSLEFYPNYGIAFGLPLPTFIFYLIFSLIFIFIFYFFYFSWRQKDFSSLTALILISFGAISNLIDRLRFGYVIDYANLAFWPVFNLADVLILSGVVILLVKNLKFNSEK